MLILLILVCGIFVAAYGIIAMRREWRNVEMFRNEGGGTDYPGPL